MELARYMPRQSLINRPDTFSSIVDEFFTPFFNFERRPAVVSTGGLRVDIYEKDDRIMVDAELPGIDKKDITVDIKGRLLTIGGERRMNEEIKEENSYRRECRYGKVERTFSLPFEIDSEGVVARYENGILHLEVAKPAELTPKQIEIQ
ncbi:MAG: Hsp20/alpha crystallin family protein [Desulfoprunum sp.]|jgi:HSP20 family protein|uniref:Hsp20/alpha crystallin family protein n=1 Tax=Desulfoprunum sp. TaxID=2020866 RepID=UPI00068D85D7